MNPTPKVSVIVPVYNAGEFLSKTIESILCQSYKNLEIVIIDDCSADNSKEIILSYKDSRIIPIFSEKNEHLCASSNIGYYKSTGEYIALIGHDDIFYPDKIKNQIMYMESHPDTSVCFTKFNIIDENDNDISDYWKNIMAAYNTPNMTREQWAYTLIVNGSVLCAPTALIRKQHLKKEPLYRMGLVQAQDYDLWVRMISKGNFHIIDKKLTGYRRFSDNSTNLSSITVEKKAREMHDCQYVIYRGVLDMDNDLFIKSFNNILNNKKANLNHEILCEKAMVLAQLKSCYIYELLVDLFEDEVCRNYLTEICNFSIKNFLSYNEIPLLADETYYNLSQDQRNIIKSFSE